ncbi:phage portal protein family protein [Mucilaginibacter sp.]|uniref:phage portal protein family protein n=1 Tax=Mucilaginibacter sp. TaxID=1882438 RepID=UPI000CC4F4DB|nr:DUF935 family protein [Mucilaginibacter sp.]PLW89995.1 MAG: hypothetical protein C0154_08710 [Mucilaginibacter sp.]PMP65789.1 MAG: hypothetical protein C0191_02700 [Mucilaginibacter sp.]
MQNAKIGKSQPTTLAGLKHGGTINLSADDKNFQELIKTDPGLVIASIVKQQRSLNAKEMGDFIMARAQAENPLNPNRALLYDIYSNAMDDPFIHGQIYNQRILPVKNKDFKIKNAKGDVDPEKVKPLKKGWFKELIKFRMESIFWGFSLPAIKELNFKDGTSWIEKLKLLERKNVHPEQHVITKYQGDFTGIDYLSEPVCNYVLPLGDPEDLGILLKAIPMYIFKKHGWQNWDEFGEMFGMPIRTVKTASQDPRVISEIEGWLRDMSTASYGIFPAGTELDVKLSNQSDAFKVFAEAINMAKEELAILFNGQTMTSMNGSSKSQGEVHERTKDEITKDDESSIEIFVNEQLIPWLRDVHNYPFDEGDEFEWDQPKDLVARLKIFQGVNSMGFQIDPKQVEETFDVKIIGLKLPAGVPDDQELDDEGNPKEDKPEEDDKPAKPKKDLNAQKILKMHADLQQLYYGGLASV